MPPASASASCRSVWRSWRYEVITLKREPEIDFERDEMLVCMVLAFCIAGASIEVIYKVLG